MSKCETVVITPSQAKVLRETANFELQRPINKHNVARLRLEMEAGRFIPGTPIYFAVMPDKSLLALNGNHTLTAAAEMEGTVELTFIYEPVQTLKEAAQIYSRFDLHRIRSWRDTLRAYSAEEMLSGSTQWTSAFAAAMGTIIEGFTSSKGLGRYGAGHGKNFVDDRLILASRNRDMRVRLMEGAKEAAGLYMNAVSGHGNASVFRRAGVMAAGIEICRYQPSSGVEFFSKTAADDGLKIGDPTRALIRYLRENRGAGREPRVLQPRAIARAWNAFFTDRQLEVIRVTSQSDMRLAGTPWNGDFDPIDAYLPEVNSQLNPRFKKELRKVAKAPKVVQFGVDHRGKGVAVAG